MSEQKAQYLTLTDQFLAAASRAKYVPHYLFCEACGETTDHTLTVRGELEIYTCPNCHHTQLFQVI